MSEVERTNCLLGIKQVDTYSVAIMGYEKCSSEIFDGVPENVYALFKKALDSTTGIGKLPFQLINLLERGLDDEDYKELVISFHEYILVKLLERDRTNSGVLKRWLQNCWFKDDTLLEPAALGMLRKVLTRPHSNTGDALFALSESDLATALSKVADETGATMSYLMEEFILAELSPNKTEHRIEELLAG